MRWRSTHEVWLSFLKRNDSSVAAGPDHPSYLAIQRLNLPLLCEESQRLDSLLFPEGVAETPVTKLKFCHNDIQENNIMLVRTI